MSNKESHSIANPVLSERDIFVGTCKCVKDTINAIRLALLLNDKETVEKMMNDLEDLVNNMTTIFKET